MDAGPRRPRSTALTLGQSLAAVAAAGGLLASVATLRGINWQEADQSVVAILIVAYTGYLLLVGLLLSHLFTRAQVLALLFVCGSLSPLMIPAVTRPNLWVGLVSILTLPALPVVAGGLMIRHNRKAEVDAAGPGDLATLAALVRNRRLRGLTPQAPPAHRDGGGRTHPDRGRRVD